MAEDNVVILNGWTRLDIPSDRVIDGIKDQEFETLVVVGITEHGDLYQASNTSDIGRIVLLLEQIKRDLIDQSMDWC